MRRLALGLLACVVAFEASAAAQAGRRGSAAARRRKHAHVEGGDSPAFAKARVAFAAPADRAALPDGDVPVELKVDGYALGDKGHVHLIVDNEPALELEEAGSFVLEDLPRGPHLLRAVLCRPWHEVVKAPGAFAAVRFWVGERLEGKAGKAAEYVAWPDPKKPVLTWVLPAGEAAEHDWSLARAGSDDEVGALSPGANRPVLDFYVSGTKLARRGAKVRVVLDKRELPLATDWKPVPLKRARGGAHKLTIDLLDRRGLKVKNAVNRTDRTFTVEEVTPSRPASPPSSSP